MNNPRTDWHYKQTIERLFYKQIVISVWKVQSSKKLHDGWRGEERTEERALHTQHIHLYTAHHDMSRLTRCSRYFILRQMQTHLMLCQPNKRSMPLSPGLIITLDQHWSLTIADHYWPSLRPRFRSLESNAMISLQTNATLNDLVVRQSIYDWRSASEPNASINWGNYCRH